MTTRKPAVAGQFYPATLAALKAEIGKYIKDVPKKEKVLACVSPHAGYIYSGHVAGALFSQIEIPNNIIVLSPNHSGRGATAAIMTEGEWETPLGSLKIGSELAGLLMKKSRLLKEDVDAHTHEHSLEVQLPFLQYLKKDFQFVPITLMYTSFENCEELGTAIAEAIKDYKKDVLLIASSDMNHYESQVVGEKKDRKAIEKILAVDPKGLYETVSKEGITMCGMIPTAIVMAAAKKLGATKAKLIKYATSGDISGDYGSVVGYASLILY